MPSGNYISPCVGTFDYLDHPRHVHLVPQDHALLAKEVAKVAHTPLVLARRAHTACMGTSLLWWQVGARTQLLVLTAVG
jgi:hypothetical protein